jgi:hypothetical protein
MTFVELQVGVQQFLAAQRTYLRRLAVCPPVLPPVAGVQIVVDRIDIGASSLRHDEDADFDLFWIEGGEVVGYKNGKAEGKKTKLAQQLTLQLTTDTEIRNHPNADPPLVPWQVTVVYELSADALGTDCWLRAHPDAVEFAPPPALPVPLPPGVVALLEDFVTQQFRTFAPSGAVPMGLDALKLPVPFVNAGLSVDDAGQCFAIRVQLGGSGEPRVTAWTNFFGGYFVDRREGRDWALYVPADYITGSITSQLWQNLPKMEDLETYPGTTYTVDGTKALLDVDILLIYHLLENDYLDLDVTVEADPHVALRLWVEQTNVLSAEIDFSGLVNPVGLLSTVAVAIIDIFGIPARRILHKLVGSAAVEALSSAPVDSVTQPTPTTIKIEKNLILPSMPGVAKIALTALLPQPDGIALAGSLTVNEPTNAVISVTDLEQFRKQVPKISCGPASMALVALFSTNPAIFALLHASATIDNLGTAPLRLCRPPAPQRTDSPLLARNIHIDQQSTIVLSFDIGLPSAGYLAAPFPIDVLVVTNGGTRLIRLDPPPTVTEQDLQRLEAELLVAIGNCQQLVDPWFKGHTGYNPKWSPRPPGDQLVEHLWQVNVSGLPEGEAVELHSVERDQEVLVRAVSRGVDAPVRVATLLVASGRSREVSIVRVGPDTDAEAVEGRGLEVRQTNFVVDGEIPLDQACHRLGVSALADGPVMIALLEDRAVAFDVLSAAPAAPLASWDGRFTGVLRLSRTTLLYGPGGAAAVDPLGRVTATGIREPVIDAVRRSSGVVLRTRDRVLELSSELRQIAEYTEVPESVAADRRTAAPALDLTPYEIGAGLAGAVRIGDRILRVAEGGNRIRLLRKGSAAKL